MEDVVAERDRLRARRDDVVALGASYPKAALNEARCLAELVCFEVLKRGKGIVAKDASLHALIAALEHNGMLPRQLEPLLRMIQTYGNYGSHHQPEDIDPVARARTQATYVKGCVEALDLVLDWYLGAFCGGQSLDVVAAPVRQARQTAQLAYLEALRRWLELRAADFVEARARHRDGRPFETAAWLARGHAVTYVSGEYGCGKTAFCCSMLLDVCRWLAGAPPSLVPVLVTLTDLDITPAMIAEIDACHPEALRRLLRLTPPVVAPPVSGLPHLVLFDGLDELDTAAAEVLIAKVIELAAAQAPALRFVIASRINALRLHVHNLLVHGAVGQEHLPGPDNTLTLPQFDDGERTAFLRKRIKDDARLEQTRQFLRTHHNLRELASRPLILSLLTHAPMGETSVLDAWMAAGTSDAEVTLSYVFDDIVRSSWQRLARREDHDTELLASALARIAYRQLERPIITLETIMRDLAAASIPAKQRPELANTLASSTFLSAHPGVQGRYQFQFRSFRDYFISTYLRELDHLRAAVSQFPASLQSTFCRRGIVDFLREMVGEAHKPFLLELLTGSDEMMVFASHLMRSPVFRDCVAPLEAAFQRCADLQGRVFIVFAILSHIAPGSPRLETYRDFIRTNADAFRDTLKLFVEGVERDVMEFNVERLNMRGHRSKAALYLLSLRDPHVHRADPDTVRVAVEHFLAANRPNDYEAELAREILTSVGAAR